MMSHLGLVLTGTLGVSLVGTYLWFNGAHLLERTLDGILEYRKRVKGGFYRTINPNERCPSCGAKSGTIAYNPLFQKVVHTCHVDGAQWVDDPRIHAGRWDFIGRDVKQAGDTKSDLLEIMDRANAKTLYDKEEKAKEKAN